MPSNNKQKPNVQLSKKLSCVLRHGAPSLGLRLSHDGFVPVQNILELDHPKFRTDGRANKGRLVPRPKYTVEDVVHVVENNDKQRFRLEYRDVSVEELVNISAPSSNGDVITTAAAGTQTQTKRVLCIRANQGHSVKGLKSDQLMTPLTTEELSHPDLLIIHGTTQKAWEDHIRHEGLSRMKRNHIHFAAGLPKCAMKGKRKYENKDSGAITTPISGIRSTSEIYIYVNGSRCANDGVPFYRSDNGVILSAGVNEEGMLPMKYIQKVVYAFSGEILYEEGS